MFATSNISRFAIVVISAALFVPAWAGGWTILWSLPFALILTAHLRCRFLTVLAHARRSTEPDAAAKYIRATLPIILAELLFTTAAPQVVALWLFADPTPGPSADTAFFQAILGEKIAFENLSSAARFGLASTATALIVFVMLSLAAPRPLWNLIAAYLHRSTSFPRTPEEARHWAKNDAVGNFCAILGVIVPCIYFASIPRLVADTMPALSAAAIGIAGTSLAAAELIFIIGFLVSWKRLGSQQNNN